MSDQSNDGCGNFVGALIALIMWAFIGWIFYTEHRKEIDTIKAKVQHLESKLTP